MRSASRRRPWVGCACVRAYSRSSSVHVRRRRRRRRRRRVYHASHHVGRYIMDILHDYTIRGCHERKGYVLMIYDSRILLRTSHADADSLTYNTYIRARVAPTRGDDRCAARPMSNRPHPWSATRRPSSIVRDDDRDDDARVAIRAHPSRRRRSRSRRGRRKNTRTFLLLITTVSHTPIHAHEATMSASMTTTRASSSVAARSASVATKASKRSSVVAAAADRKMWCVYI